MVPVVLLASGLAIGEARADGEVKRDPKGQKGITPYNEELAKGRQAFAGGDHDAAIASFDAAILLERSKLLAYLLKAQALSAKGDLDAAAQIVDEAESKEGTEEQQAKLTFFAANLKERRAAAADAGQGLVEALASKWEKVKEMWTGYVAFVGSHSRVPDYKATAEERKKQVDARVKRVKDYGAVAERAKKPAPETPVPSPK
jgi:tetratricopeptide (TPR) repeat protein